MERLRGSEADSASHGNGVSVSGETSAPLISRPVTWGQEPRRPGQSPGSGETLQALFPGRLAPSQVGVCLLREPGPSPPPQPPPAPVGNAARSLKSNSSPGHAHGEVAVDEVALCVWEHRCRAFVCCRFIYPGLRWSRHTLACVCRSVENHAFSPLFASSCKNPLSFPQVVGGGERGQERSFGSLCDITISSSLEFCLLEK